MSSRVLLVVLVLSALQLTSAHQDLVNIQTCFILDNSSLTSEEVELYLEPTNNVLAKLGLHLVLLELLPEDQLEDNDELGENKIFSSQHGLEAASMLFQNFAISVSSSPRQTPSAQISMTLTASTEQRLRETTTRGSAESRSRMILVSQQMNYYVSLEFPPRSEKCIKSTYILYIYILK